MKEEFKAYYWDNEKYDPPSLISERSILKTWLKHKIKRIQLSNGAINSGFDERYTSFEIEKIRELFTVGQLHKLFPDYIALLGPEEKKTIKDKWKALFLNLFYIFLFFKFTIYFLMIAGWKILLVIFIIIWNLFLKRLIFPLIWSVFGVKFVTEGKSNRELYEMKVLHQSPFQTYVMDSLFTPSILFLGIYVTLSAFNFLEKESNAPSLKAETHTSYSACKCADISYKVLKIGGVDYASVADVEALNICNKKSENEVFMSKMKGCKSYKKMLNYWN